MTIDLTDLTGDGDTIDLDDGRLLRLRIFPDEDATINDYESDGRIEWTRGDRAWSPMRYPRPEGFNGAARIIERDGGSALWWQPPGLEITGTAWDAATMRKEEARIRDIVRFGFSVVVLELCEKEDAYGRPIVIGTESLGGVDLVDDNPAWGALQDVLGELAAEMNLDVTSTETFGAAALAKR